MKEIFAILIGKLIVLLSSAVKLGNGSTWPGHLALKIDSDFIKKILSKNPKLKVIVVAGTNGKTTTTSLLKHLLTKFGYRVFSNQEGANLVNGVASSLVKNASFSGILNYDFAILEVDEFSFPLVLKELTPDAVILLNLFRDQLDRYGEVNTIGLRWFKALESLPNDSFLIVNGDDPYLYFSSTNLKCQKYFFGVSEKLMSIKDIPHDVDFIYCPNCQNLLSYEAISYSHLGKYSCQKCGFKKTKTEDYEMEKISYPVDGLYNVYNTHAAVTLIRHLTKVKADYSSVFRGFKPAFGRQEELTYKNKKIFILLSKNPAGFNQSLRSVVNVLKNKKTNFLIVLNDRIPDGQDVSWIWDVDFNVLLNKAKKIFVSGDRIYDMALRFKYENRDVESIADLREAIEKAVNETDDKEKLYILPTYSAMLEIRKILVGRKFL